MKNYFKKLMSLALCVMMVAGITACNNGLEPDNSKEAPKGQVILDNDFVTVRLVDNKARVVTEQVPYTKEDWVYNTTTVTYGGVSATTEFYNKAASINVECKKEGEYTFKSTAYKADKQTIVATSDPVTKNVTFANGDFNLIITYTNINSYEVTTGVTGTIENQWDDQEERIAVLSEYWFANENGSVKDDVKSIRFIKNAYTGSFTETWSGGDNITVYYNADDESLIVSADGLTIYAPESCRIMFRNFLSLKSLDLNNFDTSNVTDMSYMFGCPNLTSLDLSNFDTSNVTTMEGMFGDLDPRWACRSLTSLDLSNFDTSNVTDMSYIFGSCWNLQTIDISSFDTSNVTNMDSMFYNCIYLTSLDLSDFDTSNVTTMYEMFGLCTSLTSLDLSNFDTSNVTDMSSMFYYCTSLTTLDLSNFDTSNVTDMSYMFYYCTSLINLDLSNFDTSSVTKMTKMFYYCLWLTSLNLNNFDTSNVTKYDAMFDDIYSLEVTYNPATWTIGTDWENVTFVAQ